MQKKSKIVKNAINPAQKDITAFKTKNSKDSVNRHIGKIMPEKGLRCHVESKVEKQIKEHGSQRQNNNHRTLNPTANINLSVKMINHAFTSGVKC